MSSTFLLSYILVNSIEKYQRSIFKAVVFHVLSKSTSPLLGVDIHTVFVSIKPAYTAMDILGSISFILPISPPSLTIQLQSQFTKKLVSLSLPLFPRYFL